MHSKLEIYIFKSPWEDVRREMVEEKNLDEASADKIGGYVRMSGGLPLIDELLQTDLVKKLLSYLNRVFNIINALKF